MKISIDFDGIQEGKEYAFSFSLTSDGKVVSKSSKEIVSEKKGPQLEDFEQNSKMEKPKLETHKTFNKTEMKIESSFGDNKIGDL